MSFFVGVVDIDSSGARERLLMWESRFAGEFS